MSFFSRVTAQPRSSSLASRLLSAFLLVLLLGLLGALIGLWSLHRINNATTDMVRHSMATERLVADAYRAQAINAERYKAVALSSEPEVGEILGADIAQTQARYEALIGQLDQQLHLPPNANYWRKFRRQPNISHRHAPNW